MHWRADSDSTPMSARRPCIALRLDTTVSGLRPDPAKALTGHPDMRARTHIAHHILSCAPPYHRDRPVSGYEYSSSLFRPLLSLSMRCDSHLEFRQPYS